MGCVNLVEDRLIEAFRDPASPWAPPAARAALVADALEAAGKDLEARGSRSRRAVGGSHALTLRHAMSSIPFVGEAWTRGPFPMPGGPYTVAAGQYLHERPAAMIVGASYRQVVDMGDPEGSSRIRPLRRPERPRRLAPLRRPDPAVAQERDVPDAALDVAREGPRPRRSRGVTRRGCRAAHHGSTVRSPMARAEAVIRAS